MDYSCSNCLNHKSDKCKHCIASYNTTTNETSRPSHYEEKPTDNVNHPSHYETGKFECIDAMIETQGAEAVKHFCICNAFKYIWRHNGKNGVEDIKKARWYIDKYLELEGEMKQ